MDRATSLNGKELRFKSLERLFLRNPPDIFEEIDKSFVKVLKNMGSSS